MLGVVDFLLADDVKGLSMNDLIQRDLHRLLNTRTGSLSHLPEYGLPDLKQAYSALPEGKNALIALIEKTIIKYEPRLTDVSVKEANNSKDNSVLSLVIKASIKGEGQTEFKGHLYSAGFLELKQENEKIF